MQDLPLQVGHVDHVGVHDAERANSRRRQIERRRGTQPTRADQKHPGLLETLLSGASHLGKDQVAGVARGLTRGQRGPGTAHGHPLPGLSP